MLPKTAIAVSQWLQNSFQPILSEKRIQENGRSRVIGKPDMGGIDGNRIFDAPPV
jgi:hypothetical protein